MSQPIAFEGLSVSALEVRGYLARLEKEHALALNSEVGQVASYMADLEEELGDCRWLYTAVAVTEIATLRGELFGAQVG